MKRLYVGNIPWETSEDGLRDIFGTYGELESVRIIRDSEGRSKGFAFVEYKEETAAQEALETEDGTLLSGRTIRVNKAVKRGHSERRGAERIRYAPPVRHEVSREYRDVERRYRRGNRRGDDWR